MTISSTVRKAGPFSGNGSATVFSFGFKVFSKTDVGVTLLTAAGAVVPLTLDSDYSVTLNADQNAAPGGIITYPLSGAPLPVGAKLVADGTLPYEQPTDLTNSGGFYPEVIEDAFDRDVIMIQQLAELGDRSLHFPAAEGSLFSGELPAAVTRASRVLTFDAKGDPTVSAEPYQEPSQVLSSAAAATSAAITAARPGIISDATGIADDHIEQIVAGIQTPTFQAFTPTTLRDGVDYTSGASTSVALPATTSGKTIAGVFFDGVFQSPTGWTLSGGGTALTFSGAVPAGVGEINVMYFSPSLLGTFFQRGFGAVGRTFQDKARETLAITDFPMVGVSVQDDTSAVQAAFDVAMQTGRPVDLPFDRDVYITRPIEIKPMAAPSSYTGQVGIHTSRANAILIRGQGGRAIKAAPNFVGDHMLQLIFDSSNGWIAPMWSGLEDFILDGSGIVGTGLISNYCMNIQLRRMRATGVSTAFQWIGYGVAEIDRCQAFADVCIDMSQGGGDSFVQNCDFYPKSRGVIIGPSGGDFSLRDTVFTRQDADFPAGATPIAVASTITTTEIRDVRVRNCEFSGMQFGVSFAGSGGPTVKRLVIEGCHTTPSAGGALWTGALAHLENVQEGDISGNFIGYPGTLPSNGTPIAGVGLVGCKNIGIRGNQFSYLTASAVIATNCSGLNITDNRINNVAMGDGTGTALYLESVTTSVVSLNTAQKTEAAAGGTFISELGASTANRGVGNNPSGFATFSTLAPGSTSTFG